MKPSFRPVFFLFPLLLGLWFLSCTSDLKDTNPPSKTGKKDSSKKQITRKAYQLGNPAMLVESPFTLTEIPTATDLIQQNLATETKGLEYNNQNQNDYFFIGLNYVRFAQTIDYNLENGVQGFIKTMENNPSISKLSYDINPIQNLGGISFQTVWGFYEINGQPLNFKMRMFSDLRSQWSVMTQYTPTPEKEEWTREIFESIKF